MPNDPVKKLYESLNQSNRVHNLPDYDTFRMGVMRPESRRKIYDLIDSSPAIKNLPTYEEFSQRIAPGLPLETPADIVPADVMEQATARRKASEQARAQAQQSAVEADTATAALDVYADPETFKEREAIEDTLRSMEQVAPDAPAQDEQQQISEQFRVDPAIFNQGGYRAVASSTNVALPVDITAPLYLLNPDARKYAIGQETERLDGVNERIESLEKVSQRHRWEQANRDRAGAALSQDRGTAQSQPLTAGQGEQLKELYQERDKIREARNMALAFEADDFYKENPFFKRVGTAVRGALLTFKQIPSVVGAMRTASTLEYFDEIDNGMTMAQLRSELQPAASPVATPDLPPALAEYMTASPERRAEMRIEQGQNMNDIAAQVMETQKRMQELPTNPYTMAAGQASTLSDALNIIAQDPIGTAIDITTTSLPIMAPALIAGAAATAVGGPALGAGVSGITIGGAEYFNAIIQGAYETAAESMAKAGQDPMDMTPEDFAAMFKDRETLNKIEKRALARGGVYAVGYTGSFYIAGTPLINTVSPKAHQWALNITKSTASQSAVEASTEAGAQLAADGEITQPGAVAFEVLGNVAFGAQAMSTAATMGRAAHQGSMNPILAMMGKGEMPPVAVDSRPDGSPVVPEGEGWQTIGGQDEGGTPQAPEPPGPQTPPQAPEGEGGPDAPTPEGPVAGLPPRPKELPPAPPAKESLTPDERESTINAWQETNQGVPFRVGIGIFDEATGRPQEQAIPGFLEVVPDVIGWKGVTYGEGPDGNIVQISEVPLSTYRAGIELALDFGAQMENAELAKRPTAPETPPPTTEPITQAEFEARVEAAKKKQDSFRDEDGTVPEESRAAFDQAVKEVRAAELAAARGDNSGIVVIKTRPKEATEDPRILVENDAVLAEKTIEKMIQRGIDEGQSVQHVIERVYSRFVISNPPLFNSYVFDRLNPHIPEVGNNKQPFPVWRKGDEAPATPSPDGPPKMRSSDLSSLRPAQALEMLTRVENPEIAAVAQKAMPVQKELDAFIERVGIKDGELPEGMPIIHPYRTLGHFAVRTNSDTVEMMVERMENEISAVEKYLAENKPREAEIKAELQAIADKKEQSRQESRERMLLLKQENERIKTENADFLSRFDSESDVSTAVSMIRNGYTLEQINDAWHLARAISRIDGKPVSLSKAESLLDKYDRSVEKIFSTNTGHLFANDQIRRIKELFQESKQQESTPDPDGPYIDDPAETGTMVVRIAEQEHVNFTDPQVGIKIEPALAREGFTRTYYSPRRPLWIGMDVGTPHRSIEGKGKYEGRVFVTKERISAEKLKSLELKVLSDVNQSAYRIAKAAETDTRDPGLTHEDRAGYALRGSGMLLVEAREGSLVLHVFDSIDHESSTFYPTMEEAGQAMIDLGIRRNLPASLSKSLTNKLNPNILSDAGQPAAKFQDAYLPDAREQYDATGGRTRSYVDPNTQYVYASPMRPIDGARGLKAGIESGDIEYVNRPGGTVMGVKAHSYIFSNKELPAEIVKQYELVPVSKPMSKGISDLLAESEARAAERNRIITEWIEKHGEPAFKAFVPNTDRYVIVVPDTEAAGKWRLAYFDEKGPAGHSVYNNYREAVRHALTDHKADLSTAEIQRTIPRPQPPAPGPTAPSFRRMAISEIKTDTDRFQNRESEFSERTKNSIIEDVREGVLDPENLPPVKVWQDPKDGNFYVVGGHSRTAALKELGITEMNVQVLQNMTEAQAIEAGRTDNIQGTAESIIEQSNIVRAWVEEGLSQAEIKRRGQRLFDKNRATVTALAYLDPRGKAMSAVRAMANNESGEREKAITMAKWVGEARQVNQRLTDSHETEIFNYLLSNDNRHTKSQGAFLGYIRDVVDRNTFMGEFDSSKPLNLKAVKPKTTAEIEQDAVVDAAKAELAKAEKALTDKIAEVEKRKAKEPLDEKVIEGVLKKFQDAVRFARRDYQKALEDANRVKSESTSQGSIFDEIVSTKEELKGEGFTDGEITTIEGKADGITNENLEGIEGSLESKKDPQQPGPVPEEQAGAGAEGAQNLAGRVSNLKAGDLVAITGAEGMYYSVAAVNADGTFSTFPPGMEGQADFAMNVPLVNITDVQAAVTTPKAEKPKKPAKPDIITDPADRQKKLSAIAEAEMTLKSGRIHGRKLSDAELQSLRDQLASDKAKAGIVDPPPSRFSEAEAKIKAEMEAKKSRLAELLNKKAREGGELTMGFDPTKLDKDSMEIFKLGSQLAVDYVKMGVVKFADFAAQMIADFGAAAEPWVKTWYMQARHMASLDAEMKLKMDSPDVVEATAVPRSRPDAPDPAPSVHTKTELLGRLEQNLDGVYTPEKVDLAAAEIRSALESEGATDEAFNRFEDVLAEFRADIERGFDPTSVPDKGNRADRTNQEVLAGLGFEVVVAPLTYKGQQHTVYRLYGDSYNLNKILKLKEIDVNGSKGRFVNEESAKRYVPERPQAHWVWWDNNPTDIIAQAIREYESQSGGELTKGDLKGARSTRSDIRDVAQRRQFLDRRSDTRRSDESYAELVGEQTKSVIRKGSEYGIPDAQLTNQIVDTGMILDAIEKDKGGFILGNAAGTGKTFVLGAVVAELVKKGYKESDILYVTMNQGLIDQNKGDMANFGVGEGVQFQTYSYLQQAHPDHPQHDPVKYPMPKPRIAIFDEGHNLKNVGGMDGGKVKQASLQGAVGNNILTSAEFSIISSATPGENPTQYAFLEPTGIFSEAGTFTDWVEAYGAEVREMPPGSNQWVAIWHPQAKRNLQDLMDARNFLVKEGVFVQRRIMFPEGMVDAQFAPVEVSAEATKQYNDVVAAYDTAMESVESGKDYMMLAMLKANVQKRVLEMTKIPEVIADAKRIMESDPSAKISIFVERKSELQIGPYFERKLEYHPRKGLIKGDRRKHTSQEMHQANVEYFAQPESVRRGTPQPYYDYEVALAMAFERAGIDFKVPSPVQEVINALGADKVLEYTGDVSDAQAKRNKNKWAEKSGPPVLVVTMDKGGTGLSLHDTVGDAPRHQLNAGLPWVATRVDQVSGRTARYGMRSVARQRWYLAPDLGFERSLAQRVGRRMREMGALVSGVEHTAGSELVDFNFEVLSLIDSKDMEAMIEDGFTLMLGEYLKDVVPAENRTDEMAVIAEVLGARARAMSRHGYRERNDYFINTFGKASPESAVAVYADTQKITTALEADSPTAFIEGVKDIMVRDLPENLRGSVKIDEGRILMLDNNTRDEIIKSVSMGYNTVKEGLISPKKRGVILVNSKDQVRGTYPIEYKGVIERLVSDYSKSSHPTKMKAGDLMLGISKIGERPKKYGSLDRAALWAMHDWIGSMYEAYKDSDLSSPMKPELEAYLRKIWSEYSIPNLNDVASGQRQAISRSEENFFARIDAVGANHDTGIPISPAGWVQTRGESRKGRTLIKNFKKDKKGDYGIVSIGDFLNGVIGTVMRVSPEQVSKRNPAHYEPGAHLIRNITDRSGPYSFHEQGHGLSALVRDNNKQAFRGMANDLTDLTHRSDSYASAKTPEEGFAEATRRYITDYNSLHPGFVAKFEALVGKTDPRLLNGLRDAARAYYEHQSRPFWVVAMSYMRAKPARGSVREAIQDGLFAGMYRFMSQEAAVDKFRFKAARALFKENARFARLFGERTEDTPADIKSAMHYLYKVPTEMGMALGGTKIGHKEGIRIMALSDTIGINSETAGVLEAVGFSVPEEIVSKQAKYGEYIWLNDKSFTAIDSMIPKDQWDAFELYGIYKTLLARHEKTSGRERHDYPGMADGLTPRRIRTEIDAIEAANPKWVEVYGEVNRFMDQVLLISYLSGEKTLQDLVNIKTKWFDYDDAGNIVRDESGQPVDYYWPMMRVLQNYHSARAGGGVAPTIGNLNARGSQNPVRSLKENVSRRVKSALDSYYRNAFILTIREYGRTVDKIANEFDGAPKHQSGRTYSRNDIVQDGDGNRYISLVDGNTNPVGQAGWDSIKKPSKEARAVVKRFALPLKMDIKIATHLKPQEMRQIIADYLNEQVQKEMAQDGVGIMDGDMEGGYTADDIELNWPGKPLYRATSPRAVQVVAPFDPSGSGERIFMQIPDPLLYDFVANQAKVSDILTWVDEIISPIVETWKRLITQTLPFAIVNSIYRDMTSAMLRGESPRAAIPQFMLIKGLVNKITGRVPEAISQGELYAKALDPLNQDAHKNWVEKFVDVSKRGVTNAQGYPVGSAKWARALPGRVNATILKPWDILNFVTGQRAISIAMETAARDGAYIDMIEHGATSARATREWDKISGFYSARPGSANVNALLRMTGFGRPAVLITYDHFQKMWEPDPKLGILHIATRLSIIAGISALSAAANLLSMDDDEWEMMKERPDAERMNYKSIGGFLRVPFDYGYTGLMESYAWNLTEEIILQDKIDPRRKAMAIAKRAIDINPISPYGLLPPHLQTALIELPFNRNLWFDSDIEPSYLNNARTQFNPGARAFWNTPDTYVNISDLMYKKYDINISPLKYRHATIGMLSKSVDDGILLYEQIISPEKHRQLADTPFFGRMFQRKPTGWRSNSVQTLAEINNNYVALRALVRELEEDAKEQSIDYKLLDRLKDKMDDVEQAHLAWRRVEGINRQIREIKNSNRPDYTEIEYLEDEMVREAQDFFRGSDRLKLLKESRR